MPPLFHILICMKSVHFYRKGYFFNMCHPSCEPVHVAPLFGFTAFVPGLGGYVTSIFRVNPLLSIV